MAAVGNHGIVVPRDKELLERLYWDDGLSFPKIAAMYGVEHSSVRKVFKELGIPSRGLGCYAKTSCRGCGGRFRLPNHPKAKQSGGYCGGCLLDHRRAMAKRYYAETIKQETVRQKRKAWMDNWYLYGPMNPKGERQWITKCKALLRTTRRLLANRAASQFQSAGSKPAATSRP